MTVRESQRGVGVSISVSRATPSATAGQAELRLRGYRPRAAVRVERVQEAERVAVLRPDGESERCQVAWHEPSRVSGVFPGAAHLAGIDAVETGQPADDLFHPQARQVAEKQRNRLLACREAFGTDAIEVTDRAVCELTGRAETRNVTAYSAIRVAGHEHHVFGRDLQNIAAELPRASEVSIVSGPCLFGGRSVCVEEDDGERFQLLDAAPRGTKRPVTAITADPRLTLYELDCVVRLPRMIAHLVSAMPDRLPVTIRLDVPRVQYYCFLLDLLPLGLIDGDVLLSWFELVDRRRERVVDLYRAALRHWLEATGASRDVTVTETCSLDPLADWLKASVRAGDAPAVNELAAQLGSVDALWREAVEVAPPADLAALGYLSYAVEAMRGGLSRVRGQHRLAIGVENRSERRIHWEAGALAKRMRARDPALEYRMAALYPLEHAVLPRAGSHLHASDPGQDFADDAGGRWGPAQLVEALYGYRPRELPATDR